MNESWVEIACDVPAEFADILSSFLTDLSGNGVCVENLSVDAFSINEIPDSPRMIVKAYLPAEVDQAPIMAKLNDHLRTLSISRPELYFASPTFKTILSEDWSSSWKTHFKPLRIGKSILIVPSWEEIAPLPDDLVLHIDPGMAFGTGGHETTRLCLELLEKSMDGLTSPSLLDLGTGSGILAIAAGLLGAGRILALDIDPDAIAVARENIATNELTGKIECDTIQIESFKECFDIILANILAEELVRLASCLAERLNPGGILILSGILAEKESSVLTEFTSQSLQFIETSFAGEWIAILFKRPEKL